MAFLRTLLVVANLYAALDEDGEPAGAVRRPEMRSLFVGAEQRPADPKKPSNVPKYDFSADPVEVPDLPAYRHYLRTGELLPGDEKTAKKVGLKFRPVADELAERAERAAADFEAHYGERPAWALAPAPASAAELPPVLAPASAS